MTEQRNENKKKIARRVSKLEEKLEMTEQRNEHKKKIAWRGSKPKENYT